MQARNYIGAFLFTLLTLIPSAALTQPTAESANSEQEMELLVAVIKEQSIQAQKEMKTFTSEHYSRELVLEETDFEPESIVNWVNSNTQWVPYQGLLRGTDGVLLDRVGNSLDRSLLLAALLQDAGFDIRLGNAQLSESLAEQLLKDLMQTSGAPLSNAAIATPDGRQMASKATEQAAALATMVNLPDTDWNESFIGAVKDHWWVDLKTNEGWKSLDSLIPRGTNDKPLENSTYHAPDNLPADLNHRVTIRVIIERFDQGKLVEEVPLEYSFDTAAAPMRSFELYFYPYGHSNADEDAPEVVKLKAISSSSQDWLPVLISADEWISQKGFSRLGQIVNNPAKPEVQRKFSLSQKSLGALGAGDVKPETTLSGVWIEYQFDQPGLDSTTTRREIFDLIGPAARMKGQLDSFTFSEDSPMSRGLALMSQTRILVNSADLPLIALYKAQLELWADNGHQIAAMVRLFYNPEAKEPAQRLMSKPLLPLDLISLAVFRKVYSRFQNQTYLATPNVITTHELLVIKEDVQAIRAMDIVRNTIGVRASSIAFAKVRLEQGVLDTLMEADLLSTYGSDFNTSISFGKRVDRQTIWGQPQPGSALQLTQPEAWARMMQAMQDGHVVITAEAFTDNAEPSWWEIDLQTGTTLGMGKNGWGVELTEEGGTHGGSGMLAESTSKQGLSAGCKIIQAAAYVEVAADLATATTDPMRQLTQMELDMLKRAFWRSQNTRTIADLEKLMKNGCK